jgi:hypothetical protein
VEAVRNDFNIFDSPKKKYIFVRNRKQSISHASLFS